MKRFLQMMMIMATVIAFSSLLALSQEMGHGMMEKGQGMGGMEQGKGMGDMGGMDKKMQELQQHEKMMEGIEDQKQLMTEMKKHMQLMTDMMGHPCCQLGNMSGQSGTTSGSGSMSEHH